MGKSMTSIKYMGEWKYNNNRTARSKNENTGTQSASKYAHLLSGRTVPFEMCEIKIKASRGNDHEYRVADQSYRTSRATSTFTRVVVSHVGKCT